MKKKSFTARMISGLLSAVMVLQAAVTPITAFASEMLGNFVHYILVIVSSPMICSGHWAMSMFLWACLLMMSLKLLKKV